MERMNDGKKRGLHHRLPEMLTPEEIEAAKAARREYYRERYRKDPERQRAANLRFWARRAAAGKKQEEVVSDG